MNTGSGRAGAVGTGRTGAGRRHLDAALGVSFRAFRSHHAALYRRYATLRLGDPEAGRSAVAAVFASLGEQWAALLAGPEPTRAAWREFSARLRTWPDRPDSPLDGLPADRVDAFLLRHRLGLPADTAAEVMGVDPARFAALCRAPTPTR
ncbi:hypothetical protein ACN20G_29430 (plasmid) [Streptomyces sp. BI20]|uniref:hypothetical protein n=1 Tax=Streptomyces sp. BI20 TaxID=3403460 RepID=UPI003C79674E